MSSFDCCFVVFKYKKGSDSVLVVNKEDYYKCNTTKPIMSMVDGDSMLKFDRSGPFFFISGNPGTCEKGQKLIVVVLAVRHKGDHAPSPQLPPSSPSPSPTVETPMWSPTPSPMAKTPVWSPSPAGSPMSPSPMTWTPSFPPTAMTPSPMVSPPSTMTPLPAPPMANTPTSETPMGEAPTPDTSSDMHAPALAPSSSPTFTFLIGYVLVVVSVVWCSFFGPV